MIESAKEALVDLLSIEINTIRKAGMSAQRPPIFPWQLMDIIDNYTRYLERLKICTDLVKTTDEVLLSLSGDLLSEKLNKLDSLEEIVINPNSNYLKLADSNLGLNEDKVTNGWTTFDKLRILAKHAYKGNIPGINIEDEEQRIMLVRIRRNCDLIKAILKSLSKTTNGLKDFINVNEQGLIDKLQGEQPGLKSVQLSQITAVRKIWEIGTETVLIQTVIQVEGDVITRITPDLIDHQNIVELREALLNAHLSSMDIGLKHWKNLIGIVLELAGKLINGK